MGLLLLGQLIALLWLKGLALSATHRLARLGDATHGEIGKVSDDIAQTQKKIAALSSPSQLKKWADERGWQLATPDRFDDVTKRTLPTVEVEVVSTTQTTQETQATPTKQMTQHNEKEVARDERGSGTQRRDAP